MPRLSIDIEAKLAQFQDGLGRVERDAARAANRIEGAFRGVSGALAALGAGLTAAGLVGFVRQSIDAADQLNKLSQKVGVSVEALSALQYAAKLSDVSIEQLQIGLTRLNVSLTDAQAGGKEAAESFARLRLDPNQFRSTEQAFEAIAEQLAAMPDGFEKTAIAVKLFGRSGAELLPLLNGGKEGLAAFRAEAERLGLVMDTRTAQAAEAFNDNLTRLRSNLEGLGRTLASAVLPFLNRFTTELVEGQKAFGSLVAFINAQSIADAFRGPQASVAAYRAELDRLQKQLKQGQIVPEGLEFSDAAQERERAAIRKRIDELKKLIQTYESVANAQVKSQVVEAAPRKGLARPAEDDKTVRQEAERRARELARIEEQAQRDIAQASANAQRLAVEARLAEVDAAIAEERQKYEDLEREKFETAREYAEKAVEEQRVQREFEEKIHEAEVRKILGRVDEEMKAQEEAASRAAAAARQLGLVFSSAFEDAVVRGEKLSEVLRGLAQDILRIIVRKAVTEPIADLFSGILGGIFGGARASGGPVSAGRSYLVGERGPELFVPRSAGTIVPNGAGGTVINIDARGADIGVEGRLRAAIPAIIGATKFSMADDARRGR